MFKIVLLVSMLAAKSQAVPYFRFDPLHEVKTAVYFKIGSPINNVSYGSQTSILKHHAEDGYLLLPGVSWSLLDIGVIKPVNGASGALILGPSIDLSEPLKMYMLKALDYTGLSIPALRFILQPMVPGQKSIGLSAGPSLGVSMGDMQHMSQIKGSFLIHSGLSAKF